VLSYFCCGVVLHAVLRFRSQVLVQGAATMAAGQIAG
jgi:hypothetical protein